MAYIIYVLTYFNLINWRIRVIPEFIFSGSDMYGFKIGQICFKLHQSQIVLPQDTYIIIDDFKRKKRKKIISKYNNKILTRLINHCDIKKEYIKTISLEFCNLKNKRKYKMILLKNEIIIID